MQQVFLTPQYNNKNFNKDNKAQQEYCTSSLDTQENSLYLLVVYNALITNFTDINSPSNRRTLQFNTRSITK